MTNDREHPPGGGPPDDRLERMLRRWGAEEAAARTPVGDAPPVESLAMEPREAPPLRPHRESRRAALWRWAPVGVGFVLLVAASMMFMAAAMRDVGTSLAPLGPTDMERQLTAQLDQALTTLGERQAALVAAEQEKTDLARRLAAVEDKLTAREEAIRQFEAQYAKSLENAANDREALDHLWTAKMVAAEKYMKELELRVKTAADRLDGAAREAEKARTETAQAEQRATTAEARAHAADERYAALLTFVRREHADLPAASGADVTRRLAAYQRLARDMRLLARSRAVARETRDSSLKELVATLEVVLTQLDMTDPSDTRAARSLANLVGRTSVVDRLDTASRRGDFSADVRIWLLECQLVLAGVNRAA